eukprot:jgi/Botrbrau1/16938/Bobra.49_2s0007.1
MQGADKLWPEFAENPLNLGGDVGTSMLWVLHPHGDVPRAQEVINGVFLGPPDGVGESVRNGQHSPSDFRWFTRYAGWAPGQLQHECRSAVWFTAAAGRGVIMGAENTPGQTFWLQVLALMGGEYAELSDRVIAALNNEALETSSPPPGPDSGASDSGQGQELS